jgi:hypothetical protein
MMRMGFAGYGSARALEEKAGKPARTAGTARSLATERRFKRTAAPQVELFDLA